MTICDCRTRVCMTSMTSSVERTDLDFKISVALGNILNRPPQVKDPTARVLTCLILQGFEWAFRKSYPTKIPGMVQGRLLAPQGL